MNLESPIKTWNQNVINYVLHVWGSVNGPMQVNDIMTSHFLSSLTSAKKTPEHAVLSATMATKQGGLGIQHPRFTAIPAYFLTMKRNIQYVAEGVWTSNHTPTITLW